MICWFHLYNKLIQFYVCVDIWIYVYNMGFPDGTGSEETPPNTGDPRWRRSLGGEDPLEEGLARILRYSCLENSMD